MAKRCNMMIHIAVCPPADKVLIESLPKNVDDDLLTLYFESRKCSCGAVDVVNVKTNHYNKSAIVQFQDSCGIY